MTMTPLTRERNANAVVFIDGSLADIPAIVAGLAPTITPIVLDAEQDGVQQMVDALTGISGLDAIHIFSHGASGQLQLGATRLNADNLVDYRSQLAALGQALSADGDLLLYGCELAQGADGIRFIDRLARYTGADVAASDDVTGAGGDWWLEFQTGVIGRASAVNAEKLAAYPDSLFTPTLVGGYDTADARSVAINGNYVYLADGEGGLQIFDISNPEKPEWTGAYAGASNNIAANGDTVYTTNVYSGMTLINVSDPANPVLLGGYNFDWNLTLDVTVSGAIAYVANYGAGGLRIVDISNPRNPVLLGSYDTSGDAYGVDVVGTTVYVADGGTGLTLIDASNPAEPLLLGAIDTPGFAYDVAVSGAIAYVAESDYGLAMIDISNPASPVLLSTYPTGGSALNVTLSAATAYVANQEGIVVVDVSDPAAPVLLNRYQTQTTAWASDVAVKGHYAYLADGVDGLQVVQLSQNSAPVGAVTINGNAMQGQILTATNNLADADGLGLISYQWAADGKNIGAGNALRLTAEQIGKTISVTAYYTDLQYTAESVSSAATATVSAKANTAPTFSVGDGQLTTNFDPNDGYGGYEDDAQSVVVQPDGKILVAGLTVYNNLGLVRYLADGRLDTGFGAGGFATGDKSITDYTTAYSMALQADGKIILAGGVGDDFSVTRFSGNGKLDVNFAADGRVITSVGNGRDTARSVALQTDGKIVVAGSSGDSDGGNNDFALARYDVNGYLDTGFAAGGVLTADFAGGDDQAYSVAVQSDGKLLVAGASHNGNNSDFAVARYNADGSPDLSFGVNGKVTTDFGVGDDQARSVVVQSDGKILLAGAADNGHDSDFALARYNIDGSLDTGFHYDGKLLSHFSSGYDNIYSVTLKPDGDIVAAGDSGGDFALARYAADGSWDTDFGDDGKVTTDFGTEADSGHSVVLQSDGKPLVAGRKGWVSVSDFALARYNGDGSLDKGFDPVDTLTATPEYTEGGAAVVLAADVEVYDAELAAGGDYAGASLTLSRTAQADPQDLFSAKTGGTLAALGEGGKLVVDGVTIGVVDTNSGGKLILSFNSNATQTLVNAALQQIAYRNTGDDLPASAQLDWRFSDSGLSATGSMVVAFKNANNAPTGKVVITGSPVSGQTLTVSNTLDDDDGLGAISYRWQANGVEIGIGDRYTLTADQLGKTINVVAYYTDGAGNAEAVVSAATEPVSVPVIPGFTIQPLTASTTSEDGASASYRIQINTAPTVGQDVVVTFSSSNEQEGIVGQPDMTFTAANWTTPQTLTLIGVDDTVDDGDVPYQVKLKITTLDIFYKQLTIKPLNLINVDDGLDVAVDLYGDVGGSKQDVLVGGTGADKLHGLNKADNLSGGLGNDTLWGGYGDDNLYGEDGDDYLWGEEENDHLDGGAGNDTLDGGFGADMMIGGVGNDTYWLSYDAPDAITDNGLKSDVDTVIMPYQLTSYTLPKGIENGEITEGVTASSLTGNNSDNSLIGNDGNNTLTGGKGNDQLVAGSGDDSVDAGVGDDVIVGGDGAGDDLYIGGAGIDIVKYASAHKPVKVNLVVGTASGNDIDNDRLNGLENITGGFGNDLLIGNAANNALNGIAGNDTITGAVGSDTLTGGTGKDQLSGGPGQDVFRFTSELTGSVDTLTDFSVADDTLQLENAVFRKLTKVGVLSAANFVKGAAAVDGNDYIVYNAKTGVLMYDADGAGAGAAQQIAVLGVNLPVTQADFVVI